MGLKEGVIFLGELGAWDVLLPFFLVFLLMYALLQKTRVLGDEGGKPKNKINAAVAAFLGLLVVGFSSLVTKIGTFVQSLILFLIAGLSIAVVLAMFGRTGEKPKNWLLFLIVTILFFVLASVLDIFEAIQTQTILNTLFHPVVIIALVFIGIMYYIIYEKSSTSHQEQAAAPQQPTQSAPQNPSRQFLPPEQPFRREHIRRIPGSELQNNFFTETDSPDPRRGRRDEHQH